MVKAHSERSALLFHNLQLNLTAFKRSELQNLCRTPVIKLHCIIFVNMETRIEKAKGIENNVYENALALRQEVFVEEQKVDKRLEVDGEDNNSMHYIVFYNWI